LEESLPAESVLKKRESLVNGRHFNDFLNVEKADLKLSLKIQSDRYDEYNESSSTKADDTFLVAEEETEG